MLDIPDNFDNCPNLKSIHYEPDCKCKWLVEPDRTVIQESRFCEMHRPERIITNPLSDYEFEIHLQKQIVQYEIQKFREENK